MKEIAPQTRRRAVPRGRHSGDQLYCGPRAEIKLRLSYLGRPGEPDRRARSGEDFSGSCPFRPGAATPSDQGHMPADLQPRLCSRPLRHTSCSVGFSARGPRSPLSLACGGAWVAPPAARRNQRRPAWPNPWCSPMSPAGWAKDGGGAARPLGPGSGAAAGETSRRAIKSLGTTLTPGGVGAAGSAASRGTVNRPLADFRSARLDQAGASGCSFPAFARTARFLAPGACPRPLARWPGGPSQDRARFEIIRAAARTEIASAAGPTAPGLPSALTCGRIPLPRRAGSRPPRAPRSRPGRAARPVD